MDSAGITRLELLCQGKTVYHLALPSGSGRAVTSKWRTLLENTLAGGGPHFLIRTAFGRDGSLDHYVVINRTMAVIP